MRRSLSPTFDKRLLRAQALNRKEDKLLNQKITGLSRTEQQLQRELQQIQRARLSLQQGMENLKIPNTGKDSFDSNKQTRQVHPKRRFSTGSLLEVPNRDITKLAGAVKLPDIYPRENSVPSERNDLIHVTNSEAGIMYMKPHSPFPVQRQSLGDTEEDTDVIKAEITERCNESFVVPSYRRLGRNRRPSLPALSPISCEEFEEDFSKGENEMENENETESEIEEEGTTRTTKVVPTIRLDEVGIHDGHVRPMTCAVPSKKSNTIGRHNSKDVFDQDEAIRPGTCAVPSKESNTSVRHRSTDLIDVDQKQRLYARRGRRASAPVIFAHPQAPQAFTQPQTPSIPLRKTNQELINEECLKGKFRTIGHVVVGSVLLKSRRKSFAGISENGFPKGI